MGNCKSVPMTKTPLGMVLQRLNTGMALEDARVTLTPLVAPDRLSKRTMRHEGMPCIRRIDAYDYYHLVCYARDLPWGWYNKTTVDKALLEHVIDAMKHYAIRAPDSMPTPQSHEMTSVCMTNYDYDSLLDVLFALHSYLLKPPICI